MFSLYVALNCCRKYLGMYLTHIQLNNTFNFNAIRTGCIVFHLHRNIYPTLNLFIVTSVFVELIVWIMLALIILTFTLQMTRITLRWQRRSWTWPHPGCRGRTNPGKNHSQMPSLQLRWVEAEKYNFPFFCFHRCVFNTSLLEIFYFDFLLILYRYT